MTSWEAEATNRGYKSEKEMWQDLYPKQSLTQLAEIFNKGINTIRNRINYHQIPIQNRGGPNNTKVAMSKNLLDDIIALGVPSAAKKHGITAQCLYQRLYYKFHTSVKELKEISKSSPRGEDLPSSTDLPTTDPLTQPPPQTSPKATDD